MTLINSESLSRVRAALETVNKPRTGADFGLQIGSYMSTTDPGLAQSVAAWLTEKMPEFAELPEDIRRIAVNRTLAAWIDDSANLVLHVLRDKGQDWVSGPRQLASFGELVSRLAAQRLRERAEQAAA